MGKLKSTLLVPNPQVPPLAGLRFAVYARKSTEDSRREDDRSTTRQLEHSRLFVERGGGTVLDEAVFVDEETSGAEFKERPGLLRLLNAVENGHAFNALVMMDDDRLGRDRVRTDYVLQQFADNGIRVFCYLDGGREIHFDSETNKFMQTVRGFGAALEREKARQRCRDAAERKARQGHVAAGACYGYTNVRMKGDRPCAPEEEPDYVARKIRADEAAVVRAIFAMYADGAGLHTIARTLNGDPRFAAERQLWFGGACPPPPSATCAKGSWRSMSIRLMLMRPLYRGEIVHGKTTHVDRGGRAGIAVKRPPAEWIRVPAKHLRIVPEPLWQAVQKRLAAVGQTYLRDTRGRLWSKPDLRKEGSYLLSGLAKCGCCGGSLVCLGHTPRVYGCQQGQEDHACANRATVRVHLADEAFLAALERDALTPERFLVAVKAGVARVRRLLAKEPNRREALEQERDTLKRKVARMVAAIGDGRGPAALVQEIAKAEARLEEIEQDLARLEAGPALGARDLAEMEAGVAEQLARSVDLLRGNVPRARQLLKKLLADRVTFTPMDPAGRRGYRFAGELAYGAVLREVLVSSLPTGKSLDYFTSAKSSAGVPHTGQVSGISPTTVCPHTGQT